MSCIGEVIESLAENVRTVVFAMFQNFEKILNR